MIKKIEKISICKLLNKKCYYVKKYYQITITTKWAY